MFRFSIQEQNLMVDYIIENVEKQNSKVFKLKQLQLKKGEVIEISKNHAFKLMTTRSLYPGTYKTPYKSMAVLMNLLHFNWSAKTILKFIKV